MAPKTLVTTFDNVHEAERAVQKLQDDGFAPEGLGWVEHDDRGREIAHGSLSEKRNSAKLSRVVIGALLGGLAFFFMVAVTASVLGIRGPTYLVSALGAAAIGAAIGAAVGKRLNAFARTEVPRARAHRYAERTPAAGATVTIVVDDEEEEARALEIIRREASLHRHEFIWRVPSLTDEQNRGRISLS